MAEKTFNFNIIGTVDELKAYQSGTVVNTRILDGVTSLHPYIFYNMTSLEKIDFNQVEIIPADCCSGCSNLTQALFSTHTTEIGNYAFQNCAKFEDTELPHTLTYIGDYAFAGTGSSYPYKTHTFTMIDDVGVHTTIRNNAFYNSHLSKIDAYSNNIGQDAFRSCTSLTDVHIEIHGPLGTSAFNNCTYVENFEIDPNSIITYLGDNSFDNLAYYTSAASRNILPFDFRNSTFTSVGGDVWRYNTYDGTIYFPSTLATISGNFLNGATGNWKLYFNSVPTVLDSSYLRNDSGTTFTVKYLFPYDLLGDATVATNWSSHASQMIGYGTGFEAGTTLPEYTRSSGLAITWYSDETLTTQITTSSSATDTYYCTAGSTRVVWFVEQPGLNAASVTISDGANTYVAGDPVPVGTSITVTPGPTDQNKQTLYLLRVNGTDYTASGTAIVTMDQNLVITCLYYDGINPPFMPTLADNDWDQIKLASQLGVVPNTWVAGDTKTLTYDGDTYTARLVDTTGKFRRTRDNSIAYLYFELTELLPSHEVYNSNGDTTVANSQVLAKMNSGTIWTNFDSNLKSVLEDVNVEVMSKGGTSGSSLIELPFKLFLGREHDFHSTRVSSVPAEWNALTQDEYYQNHDTNNDRRKCRRTSSLGNDWYWDISPTSGSYMCVVGNGGNAGTFNPSSMAGVCVRFAL